MATIANNAGQLWRAPQGTPNREDLKQLEQAVNWVKGLHADAWSKSMVVTASGPASRLLVVGPQHIPNGVSLRIAGVCRIL